MHVGGVEHIDQVQQQLHAPLQRQRHRHASSGAPSIAGTTR